MGHGERGPRSTRGELVVDFLRDLLSGGGCVAVVQVERRARATELLAHGKPVGQDKSFRRARKRLGIVAFQQARRWYWRLPAQTVRDASDAPAASASDVPSTSDASPIHVATDLLDRPSEHPNSGGLSAAVEASSGSDGRATARDPRAPSSDAAATPSGGLSATQGPPPDGPANAVAPAVLAWAEASSRLDWNQPPRGVPLPRWRRFLDDCAKFLCSEGQNWSARATALGWETTDLFGCDRHQPLARLAQAGLLWLVNGGRVVELDRQAAVIETLSGSRQVYRRRFINRRQVVLPWDL